MSNVSVEHLQNDTYQVVKHEESEDNTVWTTLHQGTLADCEAYIRLRNERYLL